MIASGFVGANPEQLEVLAIRLDQGAESLEAIRAQVTGNLGRVRWEGHDGDRFRGDWHSHHATAITAACGVLLEAARALRKNATEQRGASGAGGASIAGHTGHAGQPGVSASGGPPEHPGAAAITGHREWQEVQRKYDAWAAGTSFAQPDYVYQCTSWANYRWHELGYDGDPIRGNGWQLAQNAGPVSAQPSLHAMASYGDGTARSFGHVMIVEEIRVDGAVRVSEMNTGKDFLVGRPEEYKDTRWIGPAADGRYYHGKDEIRFAKFPQ
jgi:surface antigen